MQTGWRRIKFGRGASEEQAREILFLLHDQVPEVAQNVGRTTGGKREHITKPGLG
jgi:hypothetical protein